MVCTGNPEFKEDQFVQLTVTPHSKSFSVAFQSTLTFSNLYTSLMTIGIYIEPSYLRVFVDDNPKSFRIAVPHCYFASTYVLSIPGNNRYFLGTHALVAHSKIFGNRHHGVGILPMVNVDLPAGMCCFKHVSTDKDIFKDAKNAVLDFFGSPFSYHGDRNTGLPLCLPRTNIDSWAEATRKVGMEGIRDAEWEIHTSLNSFVGNIYSPIEV